MAARVLAFFRSRKPAGLSWLVLSISVTLPLACAGSRFQFCPLRAAFIRNRVHRAGNHAAPAYPVPSTGPAYPVPSTGPAWQEEQREDGAGQRDPAADPEHRVQALHERLPHRVKGR